MRSEIGEIRAPESRKTHLATAEIHGKARRDETGKDFAGDEEELWRCKSINRSISICKERELTLGERKMELFDD